MTHSIHRDGVSGPAILLPHPVVQPIQDRGSNQGLIGRQHRAIRRESSYRVPWRRHANQPSRQHDIVRFPVHDEDAMLSLQQQLEHAMQGFTVIVDARCNKCKQVATDHEAIGQSRLRPKDHRHLVYRDPTIGYHIRGQKRLVYFEPYDRMLRSCAGSGRNCWVGRNWNGTCVRIPANRPGHHGDADCDPQQDACPVVQSPPLTYSADTARPPRTAPCSPAPATAPVRRRRARRRCCRRRGRRP